MPADLAVLHQGRANRRAGPVRSARLFKDSMARTPSIWWRISGQAMRDTNDNTAQLQADGVISMAVYKGVELAHELVAFIRHMDQVDEYREALVNLQAVWDNLALLSEMSGTGIEINGTRAGFEALSSQLLGSLAAELKHKTAIDIGFRAQVAIDILVRNLFERTADIGFLAMDRDLCSFAEGAMQSGEEDIAATRGGVLMRMNEYVRKYSVYHDIILVAPDGRVLAQLDDSLPVSTSADPLIHAALVTEEAYVETFRPSDLKPGAGPVLLYSYRVMSADGRRAVGVLCLCFRLDNECQRIFGNLRDPQDWTVITLIDADDRVVASSDPGQVPVGARIEDLAHGAARPLRFAGREYAAATRETAGYQGYAGPGWRGHVMVPVEHAYDVDDAAALHDLAPELLAALLQSERLFAAELRGIPTQAGRIQAELNRAVWNGNVAQSRTAAGNGFAKTLLWEIGKIGGRTRDVFGRSIRHLNETVVSSVLRDCAAQAALAIDIMDRNLYERANDCRWWALTTMFSDALSRDADIGTQAGPLCAVLAAINRLYTVYTDLLLFDRDGCVRAVSNDGQRHLLGTRLDADWVRQTLALRSTQDYCVSAFESSALYGGRQTYVYCAAVRGSGGAGAVGGVAIVFDSEPQFRSMLADALPRAHDGRLRDGCFGVFAQRDGLVIASTDAALPPGTRLELDARIAALNAGEPLSLMLPFGGGHYAVGARMSAGYREYKSASDAYRNEVLALIYVPLLEGREAWGSAPARTVAAQRWPVPAAGAERVELASFAIGDSLYGLPSRFVEEAIDGSVVIGVPGTAGQVAGMTTWRNGTLPVYDLAELRGGAARPAGSQVVVVRATPDTAAFGILVDALGEIPDIACTSIQAVPFVGHAMMPLLDGLVVPVSADGHQTLPLLVLSMERLLARLRGGNAAELQVANG